MSLVVLPLCVHTMCENGNEMPLGMKPKAFCTSVIGGIIPPGIHLGILDSSNSL